MGVLQIERWLTQPASDNVPVEVHVLRVTPYGLWDVVGYLDLINHVLCGFSADVHVYMLS